MGWWSATVMGGDTPLDYEGDLLDVCDIDYDIWLERKSSSTFRKVFEENINAMVEFCNKADDEIAFQVLGVLLVESGSRFSELLRDLIIKAIDNDEWAAEGNLERRIYMDNYKTLIRKYDISGGHPQEVQFEGLFGKIAQGLAAKTE